MSGHPMGLFPSSTNAPRVVVTNGMVIPNYSSGKLATDVRQRNSMYGQMTPVVTVTLAHKYCSLPLPCLMRAESTWAAAIYRARFL